MIPKQANQPWERLDALDALVGIWTISNQITQAPDSVKSTSIGQDSFQSGQVGMNIRDNYDSHKLKLSVGILNWQA